VDKYGLIGKHIDYSFSRSYFKTKFEVEKIEASYVNFDLSELSELNGILKQKALKGMNVTIPYKTAIIPFLDEIEEEAQAIGAVNTIKRQGQKLIGYNTDVYGFIHSVRPLLHKHHKKALVLGSGGASKAICYGLSQLGMDFKIVSRTPEITKQLSYKDINEEVLKDFKIVINCTPVGTYPDIKAMPEIPYKHLNTTHLLYDLVYNPKETAFMKKGKQQGCQATNGYRMLVLQAEKAWEIWNS